MSMASDTAQLEDILETRAPALRPLVRSAYQSFSLIEPWHHARCDSSQPVQQLIRDIQRQGFAYYDALDQSIKMVEIGHKFAADGEVLCDFLADPTVPLDELVLYIDEMRDVASQAKEDAKFTAEMFRKVRTELLNISNNVTTETAIQSAAAPNVPVKKRSNVMYTIIKLPIVLVLYNDNLFEYIQEVREAMTSPQRKPEPQTTKDVLSILQRASSDIQTLMTQVDAFSNWWSDSELKLGEIQRKAQLLRKMRNSKGLVTAARKNWVEVKSDYIEYKQTICKLQDMYPNSRRRLGREEMNRAM